MKKLGVIPLFNSNDFDGFTNEFGQYELVSDASDLGIPPGAAPYYDVNKEGLDPGFAAATSGDDDLGGQYMAVRSHRTGATRLYRLEQEAASGWYFRSAARLGNGEYGLVKIFND